jgi:hypothetical protein
MSKKCSKCNEEINPLRLKALPNTVTCVSCSTVEKVACHTIISGKNTYSEVQIVDRETSARLYGMQSRKGFGVANGVKFQYDSRKN